MKRFGATAFAAVLVLTGCSVSETEPEASAPEESVSPNVEACSGLESLSGDVVKMVLSATENAERLEGIAGEFDGIALSAEGDVKTRMLTLVQTIPEHPVTWMIDPADNYFEALESVGRACIADGSMEDFTLHKWG